jgi:hypothetical protein
MMSIISRDSARQPESPRHNKETKQMFTDEQVERFAKILHESGREAVEKRMIYRSDLPVKPFAEWDELQEDAKEGRRIMARYVLKHSALCVKFGDPNALAS